MQFRANSIFKETIHLHIDIRIKQMNNLLYVKMKNSLRLLALIFLLTATIQLLGVGERINHALWQWYKFYGYSDSGITTISEKMAFVTFIISVTLIVLGVVIKDKINEHVVKQAITYSYRSLSVGV